MVVECYFGLCYLLVVWFETRPAGFMDVPQDQIYCKFASAILSFQIHGMADGLLFLAGYVNGFLGHCTSPYDGASAGA